MRQRKIWIGQQRFQRRLVYGSACCKFAVFIERACSIRPCLNERVNEHVPRPTVKGDCIVWLCAARKKRQICDSADVDCNAVFISRQELQRIEVWNQRSAMSAKRAIGTSKIMDDRRGQSVTQKI